MFQNELLKMEDFIP